MALKPHSKSFKLTSGKSENCDPNLGNTNEVSPSLESPVRDANRCRSSSLHFFTPHHRAGCGSTRCASIDSENAAPATVPFRKRDLPQNPSYYVQDSQHRTKGGCVSEMEEDECHRCHGRGSQDHNLHTSNHQEGLCCQDSASENEFEADETVLGRRSRVQSLVQAFESMISLAEMERKSRLPICRMSGKWQKQNWASADRKRSESFSGDVSDLPSENGDQEKDSDVSEDSADCCTNQVSVEGASACPSYESDSGIAQKRNRVTCLQPFTLRTQLRGARKQYEFAKKLEKMMSDDRKSRIPVAQGLPWTTDEPEVVPKPPVKESTVPIDLRLWTQHRASERAEFDQYVSAKIMFTQQQREEQQRVQQVAKEDEIKRMRREMVPRAQLMPYFDRPFIPRRSSKRLTIPKEPSFHSAHDCKRAKCLVLQGA